MHSQKTGSAIRCIDTWYDENAKFPIEVVFAGTSILFID